MGGEQIERRDSRILAMQALAQLEVHGEDYQAELDAFLGDAEVTGRTRRYARDLTNRAWEGRKQIDEQLVALSQNWSPDRMASPERNILRVAAIELKDGKVPPRVVISEALAIVEKYGSEESPRFVNGILNALWKSQQSTEQKEHKDSSNGAV